MWLLNKYKVRLFEQFVYKPYKLNINPRSIPSQVLAYLSKKIKINLQRNSGRIPSLIKQLVIWERIQKFPIHAFVKACAFGQKLHFCILFTYISYYTLFLFTFSAGLTFLQIFQDWTNTKTRHNSTPSFLTAKRPKIHKK